MPAGRLIIRPLLESLTQTGEAFFRQSGGLPPSVEANTVWKDIWLEETHHSTALEGHTLTPREISELVEHRLASGSKELVHYLAVEGYARTAKWVYEQAVRHSKSGPSPWGGFNMGHVRQIHAQLMGPIWAVRPSAGPERPGEWRRGTVEIAGFQVKPPPGGLVESRIGEWVRGVKMGPSPRQHPIEWVAKLHADFEAIHPFTDGNGRAGRLVMDYLLILAGYPPAIICRSQRAKYIAALQRAQTRGDYRPLTELVGQAVLDNLNRLLLPHLSTAEEAYVPLSELAPRTPYTSTYLRKLADRGRLHALKTGGQWVSTLHSVEEHVKTKSTRGRKPAAHGKG